MGLSWNLKDLPPNICNTVTLRCLLWWSWLTSWQMLGWGGSGSLLTMSKLLGGTGEVNWGQLHGNLWWFQHVVQHVSIINMRKKDRQCSVQIIQSTYYSVCSSAFSHIVFRQDVECSITNAIGSYLYAAPSILGNTILNNSWERSKKQNSPSTFQEMSKKSSVSRGKQQT